jgi:adenylosuccinate synthase
MNELKIAVAYRYKGELLESYPASMKVLENVEVEYKTFAGWNTSISNCRTFESLPENAKLYCKFIEDYLNVPRKQKIN